MSDAAVGLIVTNDTILLLRRKARVGDPWSGHISFPGGFFKPHETGKQAVLREVYEETNLKFSNKDIMVEMEHEYTPFRPDLTIHPFIIKVKTYKNAKPGPEIAEIRTIKFSSLRETYDEKLKQRVFAVEDWIIWGITYRILKKYMIQYR